MSQSPKQMETNEVLRVKLDMLKASHRELDDKIKELEVSSAHDLFTIRRLKKQKLRIKDEIAAIDDKLIPDIIA